MGKEHLLGRLASAAGSCLAPQLVGTTRLPRAHMANVLVLYASTHGHTAKVAARIAEGLRAEGVEEVDVRDVADAGTIDPASYDAVIVGGSLHAGHHQEELVDWVQFRRAALGGRPSAFFSISLTAADDTDEAREATQRCIDDFLAETEWTPERSVAIAGALQYREYNVFTRTLMRLMMRRGGHPTDTSQDYDYTDWEAVERFGREFATLVAQTRR
jgi:menaquinone-dependent protoporphyrinogen oxidase